MTVQTLSTQLYHLLIGNDSSENIVWLSSQVQASLWWPGRFFSSTTKWFMLELIFHVMDRTKLRGIHSKHYQLSFTISSFSSLSSHDYLSGYSHAPQNDLCSNYFFHAMDRKKTSLTNLSLLRKPSSYSLCEITASSTTVPLLEFYFSECYGERRYKIRFSLFSPLKRSKLKCSLWYRCTQYCTFVKPMFIRPTWGSSSPRGFEFFFAFHLPHKCFASLNFLWSFMISYER